MKLTQRQQQVLDIIRSNIEDTGFPPTRADIAQIMGFKSANAAEEHLKALAKKGAIEMIPGTSRGIRLTGQKGIPIVGRVAAGEPVLAQEHVEEHCELPGSFFSPSADYLLNVQGDSMVDVGIYDGDLLAVHSTPVAADNQIVVARIDDEVTVKRFKRTSKQIVTLLPENSLYQPIVVNLTTQSFAIEGISVGVLRRH
ncbi:LexA repressor [Luminiphilus syltensis NOR5-1B]|uniref:LexA repressor n=1 Tax=Luminiphilus syltensis NOR5-1B TaxID=565045 RepID=B8KYH7_9GAMM|nr:LexA repressor [Luminiphilus syltensis NOR5-1B]